MYEIPLFPLNTVLFPGMPVRLHIFEERYLLMLKKVLETNRTFGICLIKKGAEALGPLPQPYETGCTARVVEVEQAENGAYNITAVGDERFHILQSSTVQPYLTGIVESVPLQSHHTLDVVRGARLLRARLVRYLALLAQHAGDDKTGLEMDVDLTGLQLPDDPLMLIYLSAALLQIPPVEKQPLLEADTASQLLVKVQALLRRELAILPPMFAVNEDQARASAWAN